MTRWIGAAFRLALAAMICGLGCASSTLAQQPPFSIVEHYDPVPDQANGNGGAGDDVLSTLQPVVRRFTFDDAETGPNSLPPNFYRFVAPSDGFPPFGSMRVAPGTGFRSDDRADSEAGALEFALAGGSMSARIGTSVVPILPYADYVVACRVRTDGFHNAQARLVAWLCDKSGNMIALSRATSRATNTGGTWQTLSLELHGRFGESADLVFELQVVQPGLHEGAHDAIDEEPCLQDVRGHAWFDDVVVSHLPRVVLTMTNPGNVAALGDQIGFQTQVTELAANGLAARLRVLDIDGRVVHDAPVPPHHGRDAVTVFAPIKACGWYRAVLEVLGRDAVTRRRWVDFVVVPAGAPLIAARNPFGVTIAKTPAAPLLNPISALLAALHPGTLVVPAWERGSTLANLSRDFQIRRDLLELSSRIGADIVFDLPESPEEITRNARVNGATPLDVLASDPAQWRPYLDDLLIHFGLASNRWMVGTPADLGGVPIEQSEATIIAARRALSEFVPDPQLHIAWTIHDAPPERDMGAVALQAPASVPAESVPEYLSPWLAAPDRPVVLSLEALPASAYRPRQQLADIMLRGLHAWRGGAGTIQLSEPWQAMGDQGAVAPTPAFAAWHTLGRQLAGKTFVTELSLGPGVHAWIARGDNAGDAVLIAWSDLESPSAMQTVDVQLTDQAVQACDAFGNIALIAPQNGMHRLVVSDLPIFVRGVSLELVLFRGGVRIDPDFITAATKVHEHHLVIRNPWDAAISGSVRLTSDAELEVSPGLLEYSIPAHGEARLPIELVPQRGIVAGRKSIAAEVTVNADRSHAMLMSLDMEVGLREIEMNASWSVAANEATGVADLLVTTTVTSRASRAMNLDVDLLGEGVCVMRRTIATLQPGQTQTRTFRIANGAALLSGQSLRLGVAERDGVARLNKVISIDPDDLNQMATVPDQGSSR